MQSFNINSYNFENDEEFQKFFKKALPNKRISRDSFIGKLNACKREWVRILNSPILKHNYGLPQDYGK